MIVLGVDPGLKNTGFCVLDSGKVIYRNTVVITKRAKVTVEEALVPIIEELKMILRNDNKDGGPEIACVEQVGWYGRGKSITLPLSHVAGAITGYLLGSGISVYFLYANQKTAAFRFVRKRGEPPWDEHQKDAAVLAKVAWEYEMAKANNDTKTLAKRKGVGKHWLHAPQ